MQTSAAINFEQVLFRFGRNCLTRSEQFAGNVNFLRLRKPPATELL